MTPEHVGTNFHFETEEKVREIDRLYLPSWVDMYEVIPDPKSEQTISICAPRRFHKEEWRIVEHDTHEGALIALPRISEGGKIRRESEVLLTVRMPARLMRHIDVVVFGY